VGVSPRPLTTPDGDVRSDRHSPALPLSRERGIFHGSKVAMRTDSYSDWGQDRLCSLQADRRPTLDRLASEPAPPKVAHRRGFSLEALAANCTPKEKPRRSGATHQEELGEVLLSYTTVGA
jgi:hypothetical protein